MKEGISLHTALIGGRLAYVMRQDAAARANEFALQILTVPQLAARLAGGLKRPASLASIEAGIVTALARPDHPQELDAVYDKPGMTRALVRTLQNVWRAGFDLRATRYADRIRVRDLASIEDVIREKLEPSEYLLPDLERLARAQLRTARAVLGPLIIDGMHSIDRLWHGLINDLRLQVELAWQTPAGAYITWFKGRCSVRR